jgi:hypothetical protein
MIIAHKNPAPIAEANVLPSSSLVVETDCIAKVDWFSFDAKLVAREDL